MHGSDKSEDDGWSSLREVECDTLLYAYPSPPPTLDKNQGKDC